MHARIAIKSTTSTNLEFLRLLPLSGPSSDVRCAFRLTFRLELRTGQLGDGVRIPCNSIEELEYMDFVFWLEYSSRASGGKSPGNISLGGESLGGVLGDEFAGKSAGRASEEYESEAKSGSSLAGESGCTSGVVAVAERAPL